MQSLELMEQFNMPKSMIRDIMNLGTDTNWRELRF